MIAVEDWKILLSFWLYLLLYYIILYLLRNMYLSLSCLYAFDFFTNNWWGREDQKGKTTWPALSHLFRPLSCCQVIIVMYSVFTNKGKRAAEKYRTKDVWLYLLTLENVLKWEVVHKWQCYGWVCGDAMES